ncbi:MAG: hypothetical protein GY842_15005 [bacterium]|nr:hypothetical protein [bacterium]
MAVDQLISLIGRETDPARVCAGLREYARKGRFPVVGACETVCSDEAERESESVFQRLFVKQMLPVLKSGTRAAFGTVNLGSRYEPGAIQIAEDHYATSECEQTAKLMVVKINAHVAVQESSDGPTYGRMDRYGCRSTCCGALASMLAGGDLPAVKELAQAFRHDGNDRLETLNDPNKVPAKYRTLLAAVTNARLQADRAVAEISGYDPKTPTKWLVLSCVSINRPEPDTELPVGRHLIDATADAVTTEYQGLGDDPATYRVEHDKDGVRITDDRWPESD